MILMKGGGGEREGDRGGGGRDGERERDGESERWQVRELE